MSTDLKARMDALKDGDIVAGRPIKVLTEQEAAAAISAQAQNTDLIDALYSGKGTQEAKAKMAKVRARKQHTKAKKEDDDAEASESE